MTSTTGLLTVLISSGNNPGGGGFLCVRFDLAHLSVICYEVRKTYDSLGRVTFESAPSDAGPSTQGTYYQQYDLLGRLTRRLVLWDAHVLA